MPMGLCGPFPEPGVIVSTAPLDRVPEFHTRPATKDLICCKVVEVPVSVSGHDLAGVAFVDSSKAIAVAHNGAIITVGRTLVTEQEVVLATASKRWWRTSWATRVPAITVFVSRNPTRDSGRSAREVIDGNRSPPDHGRRAVRTCAGPPDFPEARCATWRKVAKPANYLTTGEGVCRIVSRRAGGG